MLPQPLPHPSPWGFRVLFGGGCLPGTPVPGAWGQQGSSPTVTAALSQAGAVQEDSADRIEVELRGSGKRNFDEEIRHLTPKLLLLGSFPAVR